MSEIIPQCEGLSVEEIDQKLEEAVGQHEVSECRICFYLLEMQERRGFEDFGFQIIQDYARERFAYSPRKTNYLLSLARKLKKLPQITAAYEEGRLRWTKAYMIASIAKPEDEVMWLESALSMAVKDLERKIRNEVALTHTKLRFCLSEDQAAVVEYALEVCRKISGAQLSSDQCLEYMAAEFLATYAQEANREEVLCAEEVVQQRPDLAELAEAIEARGDGSACPDNGDLPSPFPVPPSPNMIAIFERDNWQCTFPGCSARSMLHDHHVHFRSKFGKKTRADRDRPTNRTTVCIFHHRQLHAGIIQVKGKAPLDLDWQKPTLMEAAEMRWKRNAEALKRRKERQQKREQSQETLGVGVQRLQSLDPQPHSSAGAEWVSSM